jgi:hypothetical protein
LEFFKWWMLAAFAAAALAGIMFEIVQDWRLRLLLVLLLGLPIGTLQSMVLQPYFSADIRLTWSAGTTLGWAAAMFLLLIGTILVIGGSGLNTMSESSIGLCLLQTWSVAGAFGGYVQALFARLRVFDPGVWGAANVLAWGAAGLIGANTSQALAGPASVTWFDSLGTTTMLPVAIIVYGAITGIAALLVLRSLWKSECLEPAQDGV